MSPDLFRTLLPQLKGRTREICLHLMGEPLGHPELATFLEIAAEHEIPVNLTTNGVLLTGGIPDLILQKIVRQVNISIHSFEANFGARDVMPYMRKVFHFTRKALVERPDLYINYRIWDLHDPNAFSAKNAAIRHAIEQEFQFSFSAPLDVRRKKGHCITGRLYLNFDSRFEWPSSDSPLRATQGYCHALKGHIGIHADGTVVPCCLDKEAKLALGQLQTSSLNEILASPRAQTMRNGFNQGELKESLCQRCDFVSRFDRKARKLQLVAKTTPLV